MIIFDVVEVADSLRRDLCHYEECKGQRIAVGVHRLRKKMRQEL